MLGNVDISIKSCWKRPNSCSRYSSASDAADCVAHAVDRRVHVSRTAISHDIEIVLLCRILATCDKRMILRRSHAH